MGCYSVDGTTGGDLSETQLGKEQTRATENTGVPMAVTAKPTVCHDSALRDHEFCASFEDSVE